MARGKPARVSAANPSTVMPAKAGIHAFLQARKGKEELLFCEQKRSKKNFNFLRALAPVGPTPAVSKSFFASFFSKKEALS
jgi:hypothetical protein